MSWWSWPAAGAALALWAAMPGAGVAPRRSAGLDRAATAALLRRLTACADTAALAGVRLEAVESWTPAGAARPAATETDEVEFYHGVPLELERARNDRPLSGRAWRKQERAAAALERRIDAARAAGWGRLLNLHGEIWPMARLVAQYEWRAKATGPGEVELDFTPRPGIRARSRMQTLLRHTAGYFLVDAATGQIRGGGFHNLAPVDFGAGLLARFTRFTGRFALQPAGAAWVMRELRVEVSGRELWRRVRGRETMDYRLAAAPAAPRGGR
jgi:hypothetical protein